jgi:IS5 family transposase
MIASASATSSGATTRWQICLLDSSIRRRDPIDVERADTLSDDGAEPKESEAVEHPFRVVQRKCGYIKVRFTGLMKNTTQVLTLFALANLYLARKRLMAA